MVKYNTDVGLIYLLMLFSSVISCHSLSFHTCHSTILLGNITTPKEESDDELEWRNFRLGKGSSQKKYSSNTLKQSIGGKNIIISYDLVTSLSHTYIHTHTQLKCMLGKMRLSILCGAYSAIFHFITR